MIGPALLRPDVAKEIRALFPTWTACAITLAAGAVVDEWALSTLGLLAFCVGPLLLGAQSIGHEYSHRTLTALLAQPTDRRRLLLVKLGVLASMVSILVAIASISVFDSRYPLGSSMWRQPSVLSLAALCGVFVAPWLSMICRSALPAVVFSIALPLLVLVFGEVAALAKYGFNGGIEFDHFKLGVFRWGVLGLSAIGAISGWRTFMRLEAIEGGGPEVRAPEWLSPATGHASSIDAVRARHPLWLLAKKELRLQQMTLVVAGLYIVMWATVSLLDRFAPDAPPLPLAALTVMYFGLLSVLIGSLASAEERQLGTLEWQTLLPVAAWRQWAVKAGMAVGLALVLGLVLPSVLTFIHGSDGGLRGVTRLWPETTIGIVLLTSGSLYISSLCGSGVKALVVSLPVIAAVIIYFRAASLIVERVIYQVMIAPYRGVSPVFLREGYAATSQAVMTALTAVFVVLLLRYAMTNHRAAERSVRRILWQAAGVVGFLTFGALFFGGVTAYYLSR